MGSTNLNIASWYGNCELDAVVEEESFAREMEEMYLQDLARATEIVLDDRQRVVAPGEPRHSNPVLTSGGGGAGRAGAGAIRIGNVIGAAPHQPPRPRTCGSPHDADGGCGAVNLRRPLRILPAPAGLSAGGSLRVGWRGIPLSELQTPSLKATAAILAYNVFRYSLARSRSGKRRSSA